jgi:hypothetical protein
MKPVGALTREEAQQKETLYIVYSPTHPDLDVWYSGSPYKIGRTSLLRHGWGWPNQWFDGKYGYFFSNYFHALAYSLKVKDEANRRKHHSAATNP